MCSIISVFKIKRKLESDTLPKLRANVKGSLEIKGRPFYAVFNGSKLFAPLPRLPADGSESFFEKTRIAARAVRAMLDDFCEPGSGAHGYGEIL
ncbi:MAG TPA: hypothetical protein VH413_15895 [Verrucomicrobiae bacterium]|jgi:hypothetical protein|nr:hypothetical protein [Verrucomicrobiae bacterium]